MCTVEFVENANCVSFLIDYGKSRIGNANRFNLAITVINKIETVIISRRTDNHS